MYVRPLLYSSNNEQASSPNPGYLSLYHVAVPMISWSDLNNRSSRCTADRPRRALLTAAVIGVGRLTGVLPVIRDYYYACYK